MKKEDKELLLKDLCGRLPYDIKCKIEMWIGCDVCTIYNINSIGYVEIVEDSDTNGISIEKIKPYLYPLSSMTEEQKKEFKEISKCEYEIRDYGGFDSEGVYLIEIGKYEYNIDTTVEEFYFNYEIIDWLNKNHFDYRNLIEKGLAIDATGLNIYKEETK